MMETAQYLTEQFYQWEQRGRGWHLFESPVKPEPQFHPFFKHYVPHYPITDDSRTPGILESVIRLFKKEKPLPEIEDINIRDIGGCIYENHSRPAVIRVSFPKGEKIETEPMEQLLLMLSSANYLISFEIVATHMAIAVQFFCAEEDALLVKSQLKAYFPTASLSDDKAEGLDIILDGFTTSAVELGLAEEFMRPLATSRSFAPDPLTNVYGLMDNLQAEERLILQVMFKGVINPWAESILRSVTDSQGDSFFADVPDMPKVAREKIASPLVGACIRIVAQAKGKLAAQNLLEQLGKAVQFSTRSANNSLLYLSYKGLDEDDILADTLLRQSHHAGMLLNIKELATLVHFPSHTVAASKLLREQVKTKTAPLLSEGHSFVLGENVHQGITKVVTLPNAIRLRHMHVIGATGTGKSTFLQNLICEDLRLGNGLCLIDPHGDLVDGIMSRIPEERVQDCIVFDPSDADYPVGFNILTAHSDIERDILSSDLVAIFRRQSSSWGDQMNSVLANALLAFLESTQGGTLADLRRFLLESSYRNNFLKTVKDPNIIYYWQHTFPILKSSSIGSILTRLDTFLRPKVIRNMVAQKKSLDFEAILDGSKILLVKLSQGLIGTENSYLLGSFIVAKIYQAAMARQAKNIAERNPFFLYIDEFANYITPSLSAILSGGRKYGLGLILAHQDMLQVSKYDTELASAIITNPATRVCFRLGDIDAKKFEDGFSFFVARDLQDLKTGEAIVRVDRPENDFNLSVSPLPEVEASTGTARRQAVIYASRSKYGTEKQDIEVQFTHPSEASTMVEEVTQIEQETVPKPANPSPPKPIQIQPIVIPQLKQETRHRYLQNYIKKMAEARGYIARIEEQVPAGNGRVDVSLERGGKKIACEVCVTTPDIWEAHNIEKCLAAGYSMVIVCSEDVKGLHKIQKQIQKRFTEKQQAMIHVWMPEEVIAYLDAEITKEANMEIVRKGYRVKVEYRKK